MQCYRGDMENVIWIANDHGGYHMKKEIVKYLKGKGITCKDCGSDSEEIVRYPYYADMVASAVSEGRIERGILICSTGVNCRCGAGFMYRTRMVKRRKVQMK